MGFKLLGPQILLKQQEKEVKKTTKGGIILAEEKIVEHHIGVITHLGSAFDLSDSPVKVGDKVQYNEFGPKPITIQGEDYLLITLEDIYLILED
jgi:co-chaperonin GroES (HSP10)